MGSIVRCQECDRSHRYSKNEIETDGTAGCLVCAVTCAFCGNRIQWERKIKALDNRPYGGRSGRQRALESGIKEYWVQQYFRRSYRKYGFSKVRGPFDRGPDFEGIFKGKRVKIEVERDYKKYFDHRHHKNPKFEKVRVLVVLNSIEPKERQRERLPKYIVYLDIDHFVKFWEPRAKSFAMKMKFLEKVRVFSGEFQKRYALHCDDKDREMAVCPECTNCAYGPSESTFDTMALKMIAHRKYNVVSDRFKFSRIKPATFDKYYLKYIPLLNLDPVPHQER